MNERLMTKLKENRQRLSRERFLKDISLSMKSLFSNAPTFWFQEIISKITKSFSPKFENGILQTKDDLSSYFYIDFDQPKHVHEYLKTIKTKIGSFYISIGDGPFYRIESPELSVTEILKELFSNDHKSDYIVFDLDFQKGLSLSSFSGFIEKTRITSYDEISWEVVYWEI